MNHWGGWLEGVVTMIGTKITNSIIVSIGAFTKGRKFFFFFLETCAHKNERRNIKHKLKMYSIYLMFCGIHTAKCYFWPFQWGGEDWREKKKKKQTL